jgi:hypothetical protein
MKFILLLTPDTRDPLLQKAEFTVSLPPVLPPFRGLIFAIQEC